MATKTVSSTANGSKEIDAAAKAAASDVDSLKNDIAQLRSDLQSLAGNSSRYVKGRSSAEFDRGFEKSKEYAAKATKEASNARDYVETKVRDNPLASVGIAFGTGVLLAALRRK